MNGKWLLFLVPIGIGIAGLGGSYTVPLDNDAIQYSKRPVNDAVSRLQTRLDAGETKLRFEPEYGYLRSVLKELKAPASSQLLVFSKTSFQSPRISPGTPRALYFNDEVTVGFVRTGDVLEVAALDPKQGTIFYTLDQQETSQPRFTRREECLQCHYSGSTVGVPGLLVRSIVPDRAGFPMVGAGGSITDHRSPLKERWGGWYVSGMSGDQTHLGNAFADGSDDSGRTPVRKGSPNVTDLRPYLDTSHYLTGHSDIVALMTLEHQTRMNNLIVRVGWEARMGMAENDALNKAFNEPPDQMRDSTRRRIDSAVEELLGYMLFRDEARLSAPVKGGSGFTEEFSRQGPRDRQGRSLRDFDLKTRMFRYPCSYMIYSEAFDGMPAIAKDRLYQRLFAVLTGRDDSSKFPNLNEDDREAILEIIKETKTALPDYWLHA
jgi:hypothetical protein